MTSTVEVLKIVLKHKWTKEILDKLYNMGDITFINLKKSLKAPHNAQIARALVILDKFALVDHVFTEAGDFYRISARGKRILEIISDLEKEKLPIPC